MESESWYRRTWVLLPRRLRTALTAATFLMALNLFFVAIKLLSAFKALSSGYGNQLIVTVAENPVLGLFIGVLVTAVAQSSSSTTSLVVGLVAAGALGDDPSSAVRIAIPIIMGANVGTSVTNILVSFGQIRDPREFRCAFAAATVHDLFNLLAVIVLLPLQVLTNILGRLSYASAELFADLGGLSFASPLQLIVKPQTKLLTGLIAHEGVAVFVLATACSLGGLYLIKSLVRCTVDGRPANGHIVLGGFAAGGVVTAASVAPEVIRSPELATLVVALGALFSSLYAMVQIMRTVILARLERLFHNYVFKTALRAFVVGMLFTALVQSSSVTTSLIVPLAGAGLLVLEQVFPYTLGANVGTTCTAMLAALSLGNPAAVGVATAHLLFNLLGIAIWYPLRRVPMTLAERLGMAVSKWPPAGIAFVAIVFFVVPITMIFLFG